MQRPQDKQEDWGSWAKAEQWRKESFASRTPAQRLQWLKSALRLYYQAQAAREERSSSDDKTHLR